jgi:ribonuclease D
MDVKFYEESFTDIKYDKILDLQIPLKRLDYPIGLSESIKFIFNINCDKTEQKSNWLKRPLTTEQKKYSVMDAIYIKLIYLHIKDRLIEEDWTDSFQLYEENKTKIEHAFCVTDYGLGNMPDDYVDLGKLMWLWRDKIAKIYNTCPGLLLSKKRMRKVIKDLTEEECLLMIKKFNIDNELKPIIDELKILNTEK